MDKFIKSKYKTNSKFFYLSFLTGIFYFALIHASYAQQAVVLKDSLHSNIFLVEEINIFGNKVTKEWVILNELTFKVGELINSEDIKTFLETEENKIQNLNLFVTTEITYRSPTANIILIDISVVENWYIWPSPYLELSDRNFNTWVQDFGADFSRLLYGLRMDWLNFRGRNETLKSYVQGGFTKKLMVSYNKPFFDKKKTLSAGFSIGYLENNSISYITSRHKYKNYPSTSVDPTATSNVLLKRYGTLKLNKRKGFYENHGVELGYNDYNISDSVAILNPNFLGYGKIRQQYFELKYHYTNDFRNSHSYPTKGYYMQFGIERKGFGVFDQDLGIWTGYAYLTRYWDIIPDPDLYFSMGLSVAKYWGQLPYAHQSGLGYRRNTIRGYELYIIEGQTFGVWKNSFKWKVLDRKIDLSEVMPLEQFSTLPLWVVPKLYLDTGYSESSPVLNEEVFLSNRLLFGYGAGVDVVGFYNSILRLEYSFNSRGENGFFVSFSSGI